MDIWALLDFRNKAKNQEKLTETINLFIRNQIKNL